MDSYYTINTGVFVASVDRETNEITYTDHLPETGRPIIDRVLAWGRGQNSNHVVDASGHFDRRQTEQLRRLLRSEFTKNNYNVYGSWRKGYELTVGNEYVGVTNGHGSHFRVYYRRSKEN